MKCFFQVGKHRVNRFVNKRVLFQSNSNSQKARTNQNETSANECFTFSFHRALCSISNKLQPPFSFAGGGGDLLMQLWKVAMKLKGLISGQPSCLSDFYCEEWNHRETHKSLGRGNRGGQSNLLRCNPAFIHQNSQGRFAKRDNTN